MLAELKRFCVDIESESRVVRETATAPVPRHAKDAATRATDEFVQGLVSRVSRAADNLSQLESHTFGPTSNRISRVSTAEMYEKCMSLYLSNQAIINIYDPENTENNPCSNAAKSVSDESYCCFGEEVSEPNSHSKFNQCFQDVEISYPKDEHLELCNNLLKQPTTSTPETHQAPSLEDSVEIDPQTPLLASWKLSSATKLLFNVSRVPMIPLDDSPDQGRHIVVEVSNQPSTPTTPKPHLDLQQQKDHSIPENYAYETPNQYYESYKSAIDDDATPKTPTMGTPFHSKELRQLLESGIDTAELEINEES